MTQEKREQIKFPSEEIAQQAVKDAGFCIGELARDEPRGLMFEYDYIAKWRNLTRAEKAELHGAYHRHGRGGPVTITIQKHCPPEPLQTLRNAAAAALT